MHPKVALWPNVSGCWKSGQPLEKPPPPPPCAWQKDTLLPIPLVMSQVGSQVSFSPARPCSVRVWGVEIFSSGTRAAARTACTPYSNLVTKDPARQCLKPHVGPGGRGWPPGSGTLSFWPWWSGQGHTAYGASCRKGRGIMNTRASGTQSAKALEQSATMGAGRWGEGGGREIREGGGEHKQVHTSTNTAQQDTKQHKGRKGILHEGNRGKILRSVKAAVRIFFFRERSGY